MHVGLAGTALFQSEERMKKKTKSAKRSPKKALSSSALKKITGGRVEPCTGVGRLETSFKVENVEIHHLKYRRFNGYRATH
jgi:hypothetical protein